MPNLSDPITCSFSDRRGRTCVVCHSGAGRLGSLKYNSFNLKLRALSFLWSSIKTNFRISCIAQIKC